MPEDNFTQIISTQNELIKALQKVTELQSNDIQKLTEFLRADSKSANRATEITKWVIKMTILAMTIFLGSITLNSYLFNDSLIRVKEVETGKVFEQVK